MVILCLVMCKWHKRFGVVICEQAFCPQGGPCGQGASKALPFAWPSLINLHIHDM